MGKLANKVAVITGGVSGIGLATVELFVAEGASVVVGDIQDDLGNALEARFPGKVVYKFTDVTDDLAVEALVQTAVDRFGKLDIMFNNAGSGGDRAAIVDLTAEGMSQTLALLTSSVVSGHKYAGRQFLKQGTGGSIISTASAAGIEGGWSSAAYTVAKHSVLGIVRQAVAEFGRNNIRSNAICPGVIMTPIMASAFGVAADKAAEFETFLAARLAQTQPGGRVGYPKDIAEVAVFLGSDSSAYVNGAVIPVDGGCTAVTMGTFAAEAVQAAEDFLAR
ncbi:MAG: SDR family NAD(P)-dependent oxidoreductase [Porticoccaceae bacterium]|jgi:NAD(P)-dependent dehydrogenase (short-subunit alcohol dehydrogenase family)